MNEQNETIKYSNLKVINNIENNRNISNLDFSLSNINFERIYKNIEKNRKQRKIDSNIDLFDNKQIILGLRYKVRKELYSLIDGPENEIKDNNINIVNGNILGKKRNFEIPFIDLTVE